MDQQTLKRPGRGRPSVEADPEMQARYTRWMIAWLLGHSVQAIASVESPPVHPSTVWRGVEWAKKHAEPLIHSGMFDRRRRRLAPPNARASVDPPTRVPVNRPVYC